MKNIASILVFIFVFTFTIQAQKKKGYKQQLTINQQTSLKVKQMTLVDDKQVTELYLPKGRKVHFRFRSQDVLHSAYMPHFRAQMNCVPGMVTQFGFTPKYTTEEMRDLPEVIEKSIGINKIRRAKGEELYIFDYLLLCNKICGASHYNMQMKITVVEEDEFDEWLSQQPTLTEVIK